MRTLGRLGWIVVGALAALPVATAALPDIFDELPGQYASTAWEMVDSGHWWTPTLAGVPRLQKPPLVYWLTAASLAVGGRTELAARLPTALAMSALVLVTAALGTRLYGRAHGMAAGGILATSLGTVLLGKLIMPEPFLALGLAMTLLAVVRVVQEPERAGRWATVAWGAAAFAALVKGVHGMVLAAAVVAVVALARPALRRSLAPLGRGPGPLLFIALVLPWYVSVEVRYPGFFADNFVNEQLGHVLDTHYPRDSQGTSLAIFWVQHLVWWFPWALFVPAALAGRARDRVHPLRSLPAAWLGVIAVAVSLTAQRQDYYSMAGWPAFALLVARAWTVVPARAARWRVVAPCALLVVLGVLGLAVHVFGLGHAVDASRVSAPFEARNSLAGALSGMAGEEWRRLSLLLLPAAAGLLFGGAAGAVMHFRARRWSWLPVACGTAPLLIAATLGMQATAAHFGLRRIAAGLPAEAAAVVVYDGPSHRASSLPFYTSVPVRWLAAPETEFAVRSRGIGRDRFVTEADVVKRWRSGAAVYLVTEEQRLDFWRARLDGGVTIVARSATRVLLAPAPGGLAALGPD